MVQILLEYGADPYSKMIWNDNYPTFESGAKKQYRSAFEVLLKRNPGAAELILNQGIKKYNDLDSPELVLVFDFELFLQECSSGFCDQSGLVKASILSEFNLVEMCFQDFKFKLISLSILSSYLNSIFFDFVSKQTERKPELIVPHKIVFGI